MRDDFVKAIARAAEGRSHWLQRDSYAPIALETFAKYLDDFDPVSLLDVGCGQGHDVAAFAALGIECEGIEINPRYIKEGRKRFPGIPISQGNAEKLPFPEDRFLLVYCRNLIFCTEPSKSLPEIARVLRPGGVGHVSLDAEIIQLSDGSVLHASDIERMLSLLPGCEILEREYRERIDQEPTPHRHRYYDVYFRKRPRNTDRD